jgi:hypothetical protein
MKSYSDLKTAVQKASSPEQAAGTFIDSVSTIIETNRSDPSVLNDFVRDLRSNKQSLLHTITGKLGS